MATSPVLNQPSSVKAARVASGLFQYFKNNLLYLLIQLKDDKLLNILKSYVFVDNIITIIKKYTVSKDQFDYIKINFPELHINMFNLFISVRNDNHELIDHISEYSQHNTYNNLKKSKERLQGYKFVSLYKKYCKKLTRTQRMELLKDVDLQLL